MNPRVIGLFTMAATLVLSAAVPAQTPLDNHFTYQGQIKQNGSPYNGTCDFIFDLYPASLNGSPIGSSFNSSGVSVSAGMFIVHLEFASNAFNGDKRWLEIQARCPTVSGTLATLSPRQELTASPHAAYALQAGTAGSTAWSGLTGVPAGFADGVDNDTLYTAGNGLSLSGTQFSVNTGVIQQRVTGTCAAGNAIRIINADGTVTCQADANSGGTVTAVTASAPLASSGGATPNISLTTPLADTNLATLSTAGKVANSATTATSANTAGTIVARDGSGNFSANVITASLSGLAANATNAVNATNATNVTGTVAVANGGTGTTSGSITGPGALTFTAAAGNINLVTTGTVDVGSKKVTSVAAPTAGTDAANKTYVDTAAGAITRASLGAAASGANGDITSLTGINTQAGVTLSPFGTVAGNTGEVRYKELAANGSDYVALKAPDNIAASTTWVLPAADGSSGQVLQTNGSGALGWVNAGTGNVSSVGTGTGLTGGPITGSGTIALANTAVTPSSYTRANITVDQQGRLTAASNGAAINLASEVTGTLADTNLAAISTAGKVANSATTATSANTAGAIVARDGSGNFSANVITATTFSGTATAATTAGTATTATNVTGTVAVANGGTGTTSGSITGTGALTFTAAAGNNNVNLVPTGTGAVDVASKKLTSVAAPTAGTDAANKTYVDTATGAITRASLGAAASGANGDITSLTGINTQAGVTLSPFGTVAGNTGEVRYKELAANGSDYVALKAPDNIAASTTWVLPAADGSSGQVLQTNGSGALGWASAATGTVTSVTASAPLASSGGTTPNLSLTTPLADSNLAAISTAGKVANSATTATSANTANAIVARDSSGNFSANVITATTFSGTATAATTAGTATTATNVTGTVAVANGGTGTTSGSITGTGALTFAAAGTNNNVNLVPTGTGTVDVGSKKVTSVATPSTGTDAANKTYVDTVAGAITRASLGAAASGVNGDITSLTGINTQAGITLSPFGTNPGNTGEVQYKELAATGSNYVALKAPDNIAANTTWVLPAADGSSGQLLQTNGSGTLGWASAATGTVTSVGTGTGLTGGPITGSGTVSLANTAVTPSSYTRANITVDQQGRLTAASNGAAINLGTEVTGTLAVANGGTGTTSGSITGTGALTFTAAAGDNNVNLVPTGTGTVDVASKKVTNVAAPTAGTDAANKTYVDGKVSAAGTVTSVGSGTGLTGGPITGSGTLSLADTAVAPASYTRANITVDQQGRLTAASNGAAINLASEVTGTLADTNLATISTAGKVANSATTATSANTASTIVARDSSGNFSSNVITTANGNFASAGDAKSSIYVLRNSTTDATPTFLFLDGSSGHITVPVGHTISFDIMFVAESDTGTGAGSRFRGVIKNVGGTTSLIGTVLSELLAADSPGADDWETTVTADDDLDALKLTVTGTAATNIRWVAMARTVEVGW